MKNKNILRKIICAAILFFAVWLLQACSYNNVEELTAEKKCDTDTLKVVSFSKHIKPILVNNCALSGCHNSNSHKGGLILESSVAYDQLIDGEYVDTINPKFSVLYSSLVSVSDPMPPTGKLDLCDLNLIEKWMEQKAKNN